MKQVASFDPQAMAVEYYFGDLTYWKLPNICVQALEHGFDGRALRIVASLATTPGRLLTQTDIRSDEIDAAFREMGVNAPIPKNEARLVLATNAVRRALSGESNVFDEATHIRIHLCNWDEAPPELQPIVKLSARSGHAFRAEWNSLEERLREAMSNFLNARK
jgi:hypothetical protein